MPKKVCIVLPTLNEEPAIGNVIDEIPGKTLNELGYLVEILVTDSGSTDRTLEIVKQKGVRFIHAGRGKGSAVTAAFKVADADFIFMLDGDFTYPAAYIPEMLKILETHPIVIGSRLKGKRDKGALRRTNFIGNHLLTLFANILYGTGVSDLCTGYWGFRREVIGNLHLTVRGFQIEAEILTQVAKHGYKIGEIPITYRARRGKAKLGSFTDGFKIGWFLLKRRFSA